jgi:hypothetical protein
MNDPISRIESHIHRKAEKFRPALLTGIYVGALMIIVMLGALVAANRVPALDAYALERNAASYGAFVILFLVPVVLFLKRPRHMFLSAMVSWMMFVIAYNIAGLFFWNLFGVLRTPLEALVEGGLAYGILAAVSWVARTILQARRHSAAHHARAEVLPHR